MASGAAGPPLSARGASWVAALSERVFLPCRCSGGMLRFMSDVPVPVSEREAAILADPVVVAAIVAGVQEAHEGRTSPVDWSVFDV